MSDIPIYRYTAEHDLRKYVPEVREFTQWALDERIRNGLDLPPSADIHIKMYPAKDALATADIKNGQPEINIGMLASINSVAPQEAGLVLQENLNALIDMGAGPRVVWDLVTNPDQWAAEQEYRARQVYGVHTDNLFETLREEKRTPQDIAQEAKTRRSIIEQTYQAFEAELPATLPIEILQHIRHELEHLAHMRGPLYEGLVARMRNARQPLDDFITTGTGTRAELADAAWEYAKATGEFVSTAESRAWAFNFGNIERITPAYEAQLADFLRDRIFGSYTQGFRDAALEASIHRAWAAGKMDKETERFVRGQTSDAQVNAEAAQQITRVLQSRMPFWTGMVNSAVEATAAAFTQDVTRLNNAIEVNNFDDYVKIMKGEKI